MHRFLLAGALVCLSGAAAWSANAKVDAAVKVFNQVASDPAKLKTFCSMAKVMNDAGDDQKKMDAASGQIDGFIKQLGPDFETAWGAGDSLEENSADGKAYSDALDKLEDKCPG